MKSCVQYRISLISMIFAVLLGSTQSLAQSDSLIDDYSYHERNLKLNALVVGRYITSLSKNVDYQGRHYPGNEDFVKNSFEMKYVRLSTTFLLNDKISTSIMVNLAEFKNEEIRGKVLENAFVSYRHNSYFNLMLGQFRPFFGLEDLYPFQLENSYAWSRQYFLFGKNGWQSFQIGAAVFGSLESNILSYYLTAYNGNNKNAIGDNDSSKNFTFRLEYMPVSVLKIGVNAGKARYKGQNSYAYGIDGQFQQPLGNRFDLAINAEYKKGTNFEGFHLSEAPIQSLDEYQMEGFYLLSNLRYKLHAPRLRALEVSLRQEYLDRNTYVQQDKLFTYVPMLSLVFAGNHDAKLSLVGVINDYKKDLPETSQYDSNKMLLQFQVAY